MTISHRKFSPFCASRRASRPTMFLVPCVQADLSPIRHLLKSPPEVVTQQTVDQVSELMEKLHSCDYELERLPDSLAKDYISDYLKGSIRFIKRGGNQHLHVNISGEEYVDSLKALFTSHAFSLTIYSEYIRQRYHCSLHNIAHGEGCDFDSLSLFPDDDWRGNFVECEESEEFRETFLILAKLIRLSVFYQVHQFFEYYESSRIILEQCRFNDIVNTFMGLCWYHLGMRESAILAWGAVPYNASIEFPYVLQNAWVLHEAGRGGDLLKLLKPYAALNLSQRHSIILKSIENDENVSTSLHMTILQKIHNFVRSHHTNAHLNCTIVALLYLSHCVIDRNLEGVVFDKFLRQNTLQRTDLISPSVTVSSPAAIILSCGNVTRSPDENKFILDHDSDVLFRLRGECWLQPFIGDDESMEKLCRLSRIGQIDSLPLGIHFYEEGDYLNGLSFLQNNQFLIQVASSPGKQMKRLIELRHEMVIIGLKSTLCMFGMHLLLDNSHAVVQYVNRCPFILTDIPFYYAWSFHALFAIAELNMFRLESSMRKRIQTD
eukprot:GHVH01017183.1.p1 GENE.GHVH01017183.1~~GHVH01017183.1.p1  ORF type:complete len:548 (-),score=40.18 GHVH01017183.1:480-2123(-)